MMETKKIIRMTEQGKKPEEIADALFITVDTLRMFCRVNKIKLNLSQATNARGNPKNTAFKPTEEDLKYKGKNSNQKFTTVREAPPKPKNELEQVVENMYFNEGLTQRQIALDLNISQSRVSQYLKTKKHRDHRNFQQKKYYGKFHGSKEEVNRMYNDEGMTRKQIAEYFDVSIKTVDAFMSANNIRLQGEKGLDRRAKIRDMELFKTVVKSSEDVHEVAEHFDITPALVYHYMQVYGLEFRRKEVQRKMDELGRIYKESGMSLRDFCIEHNITPSSEITYSRFYGYLRRNGIDTKKVNHKVPAGRVEMTLAGIKDIWYDLEGHEGKYKINEDGLVVYYSNKRIKLVPMERVGNDYKIKMPGGVDLLRSDLLKQFEGK